MSSLPNTKSPDRKPRRYNLLAVGEFDQDVSISPGCDQAALLAEPVSTPF